MIFLSNLKDPNMYFAYKKKFIMSSVAHFARVEIK